MKSSEVQQIAFQIILSSANGKTLAHDAIQLMKEDKFEEAEQKLEESNDAFIEAHNAQTELLQSYAGGEEIVMEIIMVHAQDHLMTGMSYRDMALELLEVYKRLANKD
ncbi:PTS lactose/cellobiose transporter subunit IIA [Aerococcus sanguinicola]|uniref:PTS cellobiose transporter subunit IIA n=1 Tax=Aerococcus sanguinicola TaxID=119206 RepID=A0A2I1MQD2_9LACT|nr:MULTISPECIES: PTS lactose/cellobiose transporter subunit IIA [Aerococcus]MDK7050069.1 PTS lactose/cellobiose transporter subunit IIA [Aerococcus sanguinicola]OFT93386.1 PTS cellobiose transporter subunit IIA [Aerococcus sp. HMSC23C02]PKZ22329.1 PTS cellobiose transporter subunit IIA [Aerococcus sanguinicola]